MGEAHADDRPAPPLRVAFRTLGCKVNQAESERIAAELLGMDAALAEEDDAAVVIVNSCTVTAEADAKVRKAVRRALNAVGAPLVVVTGCLASLEPSALVALGDRVVVEPDKEEVAARVAALLGRLPAAAAAARSAADSVRATPLFHARAMVKVEEGCDARCAYCIVPDARGAPRSETIERVVAEVAALHEAGVREVVLTGTNVGRFDGGGGRRLPALLRAVASTGVARIRVSSIEPLDVDDDFLEAAASVPAFVPHLHVPLQSGADRVLAGMHRGYDAATYLERVAVARDALPGLAVTTDVLAGFPGETAEDAAATVAVCEEAGFQRLHVFRYSVRPGTPAASLPDRVPAPVIAERAAALRALSNDLFERYRRGRLGGHAAVLVERVETGRAEGTSEDYLRVRFSLDGVQVGDVVDVVLTGAEGAFVLGEAAEAE